MTINEAAAVEALEHAARRSLSRLAASEIALQHWAKLKKRGELGGGMALPPVERPKRRENVERDEETVQRVKDRNTSLAKQGTPLAERTQEPETRVNLPTRERRAAIETALETYATTVRAGRDMASEAWRVVPVVESMRRHGQLGEDEERAAEIFYKDFILGHRVGGLVASYGESTGRSLEPSGELRQHHHTKFVKAVRAIGHWPTIEWMVRIVCEQLKAAETKPPTLADAGRGYMGYKDPKQAQASGATLLKTGLERLVRHYAETGAR